MIESLQNSVVGLQRASLKVAKAADNVANADIRPVHLDQELVNAKVAEQDFAANAEVLHTANSLHKTLIDILA